METAFHHRRPRRKEIRGSSSSIRVMDINTSRINNNISVIRILITVFALINNTHLTRDIIKVSNVLRGKTTCIKANTCSLEDTMRIVVLVVRDIINIINSNNNNVEDILEVTVNSVLSKDSIFVRTIKHLVHRIGLRHRNNLLVLSIVMS